jgi:hypothetical protein
MKAPDWAESDDPRTVLAFETDVVPDDEAIEAMRAMCEEVSPCFLRRIEVEDNSEDMFVSQFGGDERYVMVWVFPGLLDPEQIETLVATMSVACERYSVRCHVSSRGSEFS